MLNQMAQDVTQDSQNSKSKGLKSYHVLFIALSLVGIIVLYVIWNIGLLKPVQIEQSQMPEFNLIFKSYQGPYHEIDKALADVEKILAQEKVDCDLTFGRYYDNPNEVEPERTRADVGCIMNTPSMTTSEVLKAESLKGDREVLIGIFEGAPWLTAFKVYKTVRQESFQRNRMIDPEVPVLETYEPIENGYRTKVYFTLKPK